MISNRCMHFEIFPKNYSTNWLCRDLTSNWSWTRFFRPLTQFSKFTENIFFVHDVHSSPYCHLIITRMKKKNIIRRCVKMPKGESVLAGNAYIWETFFFHDRAHHHTINIYVRLFECRLFLSLCNSYGRTASAFDFDQHFSWWTRVYFVLDCCWFLSIVAI